MIERYTRPEIGAVWAEQRKLETWLEVELAAVGALAATGVVPREDAAAISERAAFTVEAVKERERVTDHDMAAFVDVVAAHTELPVVGVPLVTATSVAGGLDAMLAIAQMPPGVPVGCVGVNGARNAAVLAARIIDA